MNAESSSPRDFSRLPIPVETFSFGAVRLHFDHLAASDLGRGLVPGYHFRVLLPDGTDAGHLNVRVGDTEHVLLCAGHIGFAIHEPHRGHGYAFQACRAVAPFVRSFYESVTITCDPDNAASRRTIERLGAQFLDEVPVPPGDPHYARGSRSKRQYLWTPSSRETDSHFLPPSFS